MSFSDQSVPKLRHHKATGQGAVVLNGQWLCLLKTPSPLIAKDLCASPVWACCAIMPPHRTQTEA